MCDMEKFDSQQELHDHSREFYVPLNFIGMVALADGKSDDVKVQLQLLAQRLQGLQRKIYLKEPNDKQIGISHRRPSRRGMAMHGDPQEHKDSIQPTCSLAIVREVRSPSLLHVKEGSTWEQPCNGPRTAHHPSGVAGTGGNSSELRHDGSKGEWQDHGDQGQDVASGSADITSTHDDLRGVHPEVVEVRSCRWQANPEHAEGGTHAKEDDLQGCTGDQGRSRPECCAIGSCSCGIAGNTEDHGGEDQAGGDGAIVTSEEVGLSHGAASWREGCDERDECPIIGRRGHNRSTLWTAVMDLRRRIRGLSERGGDSPRDVTCDNPRDVNGSLAETVEQDDGLEVVMPPESSNTTFHYDAKVADGTTLAMDGETFSHTTISKQQSTTNEHGVICHPAPDEVPLIGDFDKCQQSKNNLVGANLAKRLAVKAAMIGAMVLAPTASLMGQLRGASDFLEIACSPESALSNEMIKMGHSAKRINYKEGFDLETRRGTSLLKQEIVQHAPRMSWISLPCTRLSPLVNLTQCTDEEWAAFEKRQSADLRRADEVADGVCEGLDRGMEFAWEWPTNAVKGWRSRAIRKLIIKCKQLGIPLYWARMHGCAYGLQFNGIPVQKGWTILTTNRRTWLGLQRRCRGHVEHVECRGKVATASAYYPPQMVRAVAKALSSSWSDIDERAQNSLGRDIEVCLCDSGFSNVEEKMNWHVRNEEPEILALSRTKFPEEPPQGKKLERCCVSTELLAIHQCQIWRNF